MCPQAASCLITLLGSAWIAFASTALADPADTWQSVPGPKGPGVEFNCRAILIDPDGVIYVGTRQEEISGRGHPYPPCPIDRHAAGTDINAARQRTHC
jgi:hypothetical protein